MSRAGVLSTASVVSAALLVSLSGPASAATPDQTPEVHPYAVAGTGTVPGAPTDHYTDRAGKRSVLAPAAVNLPFDFTFDVQYTLDSRDFYPSNGRACINAAVTSGQGEEMEIRLYDFWQEGPTIAWYTDGTVWQYCFTGLDNSEDYYFEITHVSGGPALGGYGSVTG